MLCDLLFVVGADVLHMVSKEATDYCVVADNRISDLGVLDVFFIETDEHRSHGTFSCLIALVLGHFSALIF
jgi:hypothetical protein